MDAHPLTARRKELGLSQKALAEEAGCRRWMINRIEKRKRRASRDLAVRIQEVTGLEAKILLDLPEAS